MIRNLTWLRLLLPSTFIITTYGAYKLWKLIELKKIRLKSEELLRNGYLLINSISPARKQQIWTLELLPRLLIHWNNIIKDFDINNPNTWPQPENGRSYETSLRNDQDHSHLPKLFSTNYEIQAIIAYLFDSRLKTISYGMQSHWRFLLLSNPLQFICNCLGVSGIFFTNPTILICGNDYGWNLLNWPSPVHGISGQAISHNAHIDNGHNAIYQNGVPTSQTLFDNQNINSKSRILSMLLSQIAIIFYCDTPGNLGADEGITGFYKGSHRSVIEALLQYDIRFQHSIPITQFNNAIKNYGDTHPDLLEQVTILDGKAVLAVGTLVHTLMWAISPMISTDSNQRINHYPRCIQNAKIFADDPQSSLMDILRLDPEYSLIHKLVLLENDPKGSEPAVIDGYVTTVQSENGIFEELCRQTRDRLESIQQQ